MKENKMLERRRPNGAIAPSSPPRGSMGREVLGNAAAVPPSPAKGLASPPPRILIRTRPSSAAAATLGAKKRRSPSSPKRRLFAEPVVEPYEVVEARAAWERGIDGLRLGPNGDHKPRHFSLDLAANTLISRSRVLVSFAQQTSIDLISVVDCRRGVAWPELAMSPGKAAAAGGGSGGAAEDPELAAEAVTLSYISDDEVRCMSFALPGHRAAGDSAFEHLFGVLLGHVTRLKAPAAVQIQRVGRGHVGRSWVRHLHLAASIIQARARGRAGSPSP